MAFSLELMEYSAPGVRKLVCKMLEFLLIVVAVATFLTLLIWQPVQRAISVTLDLSILAVLVLVISVPIWLFFQV